MPGRQDPHGFSLIEVIAVVLIVAIFLVVGFMSYVKAIERAKAGVVLGYLATLRAAEMTYRAQHANLYTNTTDDLDVALADESMPKSGWSGRTITLSGSPPGSTGMATFRRDTGWYHDQQLGIQYGSGTVCGNFEPSDLLQKTCGAD